jgi:histone deacetylase 6
MDIDDLDTTMELEAEVRRDENGFIDPRDVYRLEDADFMDGSADEKSDPDRSQSSSPPVPRKFWKPTGCCYDDRMKLHANAEFSAKPAHPEDPRRIEAIMKEFKEAGLIYNGPDSDLKAVLKSSPTCWMYRISAREATKEEICLVHLGTHYDWVQSLSTKTSAELRDMTAILDQGRRSLYVGNLTYEASLISAGGAIETCKHVVAGNVKNAIAIIRPPGHHAEHNESMGFCLFNNVSIAAKVCQADYPKVCRKILILDWDVHHGNGIQNIFYEDPNVLYISLHVYNNGEFYPGASDEKGIPDGDLDKCGLGAGIGKNVNIGWHDQGMGDGEYMAAFQRIVMPISQEFDPDLVIVAAGFDAATGDELGGCYVTPACYAHMTHMLMSLADGKVAVCLEGGYNLKAISRSALAVAKTLMGEPPERITIPPINIHAAAVLDQVKDIQAPYWECMRQGPRALINPRQVAKDVREYGATPLNHIIRAYQQKVLSTNHKMISLYVQREKLAKTFQNQVLVTQGLHIARRILFIIHDP